MYYKLNKPSVKKIVLAICMFFLLTANNVKAQKRHYKSGRSSAAKAGQYKNSNVNKNYIKRK